MRLKTYEVKITATETKVLSIVSTDVNSAEEIAHEEFDNFEDFERGEYEQKTINIWREKP